MIRILAVVCSLLLFGCQAATLPREHLDPVTVATLTVQTGPIVLASDDSLRASNVRDYVQLTAIQVNRMGTRDLYLAALLWSTIDRSAAERASLGRALLDAQLVADDRPLELRARAADVRPPGIGTRPLRPPVPNAQEFYFPIGKDELRAIAQSATLTLVPHRSENDAAPTVYREWQDGRAGLRQFLETIR